MSQVISETALLGLVEEWIAAGTGVAGPVEVKGRYYYGWMTSAGQLRLDGERPANSIKEFFFPRHERLFRYRLQAGQVELMDEEPASWAAVVVAARPCDAAALPILDHVFNWDYRDERYNQLRRNTAVVTLACRTHDDACFCTSVGGGPADAAGSDAMLFSLGEGLYEVRSLTEKGAALFAGKTDASDRVAEAPAAPPRRFDAAVVEPFESPFWAERSLACLGCGACAYTCPTCHCFDIVDEGNAAGGARVKNWDACQFPLFTLHASGHNPRATQGQRQRQRIYHKFRIYPEKFGRILCTGCGNCTRNCPVGLGVLGMLA